MDLGYTPECCLVDQPEMTQDKARLAGALMNVAVKCMGLSNDYQNKQLRVILYWLECIAKRRVPYGPMICYVAATVLPQQFELSHTHARTHALCWQTLHCHSCTC